MASQEISYAKARILTRWADADNEEELLDLARERSANRLSVAIARALADDGETDAERDVRLHGLRSLTTSTDSDGMTIVRIVLPPSVAKPVVAAVDELVRRIAETPADASGDSSADESGQPSVAESSPTVVRSASPAAPLPVTLRELRQRWQPASEHEWSIPSLGQQRADAFVALFLGLDIDLTTEVVVHVRGDGVTFDDGTPTTSHAILRQLDRSFTPCQASKRRTEPLLDLISQSM